MRDITTNSSDVIAASSLREEAGQFMVMGDITMNFSDDLGPSFGRAVRAAHAVVLPGETRC
jgi:hypothetical protein